MSVRTTLSFQWVRIKSNNLHSLLIAVITYIASVWTICAVFGSVGNFSGMVKAFSVFPYICIRLDLDEKKYKSTNNPLISGIEFGCSAFIVQHSVALDFLDVFVKYHDEAGYRSPVKYVLVMMDYSQSDNFLNSMRDHSSVSEILNLLVFRPMFEKNTIDLLTNRFVGTFEHTSEFYLLDRYHVGNGSFEYGSWLFPDKTIDLCGRSVRVATFNVNPYVFIRETDVLTTPMIRSENRSYSLDGLDGILLVEFCRRRNCSIELIDVKANMWGAILPNRTGNGILGNLVERRADLGVGAISSWLHCYQYLAFSAPIQRGIVTCLVPKPNLLPRWALLTMEFSASVYLAIFCTFCIVVLIYMLITHLAMCHIQQRSVVWNIINVLAIFLLQSTNVRNRSASEAILSLTLLLFCLNLGSIYSGKYASLRAIPLYEPAINTMADLAESGIPWLQAHEAWSFSLLLSKNPSIMQLVSNFRVYPSPELRQIADQGGSAFAMGRLHNGHLMLGDWITPGNIHKYRLMRDQLYYEYETAMGTKTWPLMEALNDMISQMASGQLLGGQELRVIYQYNDYYIQTVAMNSHEQSAVEPKVLGLEDVLGGLFVLGFGLLCAAVMFALEYRHMRKSQP